MTYNYHWSYHFHCSYNLSLFIPLVIVHTICHCSYSDKWYDQCLVIVIVHTTCHYAPCHCSYHLSLFIPVVIIVHIVTSDEQWQVVWTMTLTSHCSYHLSLFISLVTGHTVTSVEEGQVVWTMTGDMNSDLYCVVLYGNLLYCTAL